MLEKWPKDKPTMTLKDSILIKNCSIPNPTTKFKNKGD
jgi:hypothetical protein